MAGVVTPQAAAQLRRQTITTVVRSVLTVSLMVALYYRAPLDHPLDGWLLTWLALVTVALVAALSWQIRSILTASTPHLKAAETGAIGLSFLLLCYATVYSLLSFNVPASFTQVLGRTDALYFTITVFATVGFGDISPATELARIVTMTQMVAGLLALGVVAKLLVGAVDKANEQKRSP